MSAPRRSLRHLGNAEQGSAFHELVVAPTFTPELARPYRIPGTDIVLNPLQPQPDDEGMNAGNRASPAPTNTTSAVNDTDAFEDAVEATESKRLLYVHVTVEWKELPTKSARTASRLKQLHLSKLVSRPIDVLATTRVEFIPIALSAHGYDEVYVAGVANGPVMRIFWTGSPGGKAGASVIQYDDDWKIIKEKLGNVVKTSKKLDTVSVIFDLDTMEGFKQRSKRMHSPDPYESELSYGTRVPNADNFTPAQIALGAVIDRIKAAHFCKEHGTCFINGDLQHIEMNRFRLTMWGRAVESGQCAPEDPPPKELLSAWTGSSGTPSMSKPRGRTGPFPAQQLASTSTSDTTNLLLTTMMPVMAMMAQNMASNVPPPAPIVLPPASRSPPQASSPPPPIEDDLDVFMDAFRRAKNTPDAVVDAAKTGLRDARYTPDILSESSVSSERLMELTGLAEGRFIN
ncbi:hypothetical protein C8R43DRAFT_954629 [Mycena crocata]|nr:hypothetical protein C8R43DRAFT_954629 [Mycena crocata]